MHIVRDPRTMLIALLIPVLQLVLFGFAISTEVNNVEVAVVAPDITPEIEQKVSKISHNPYFSFRGYIDANRVDECLTSNHALAVIVFSSDYEKNRKCQIVVDGSDPTTSQSAVGYLNQVLAHTAFDITPEVTILFNPRLKSSYNFVPGIMGLIFLLICAMLTSVSIVREKETGTMEVLLVSPIRPTMIVIAKMIPYFLLACIDLLLILVIARYALDVPLSGSMVALFVISLIYLILALALGLFISTIADSQMVALLLSGMVLIIPVIMLSGMIFPVENMPQILQWISNIVPAKWYISAMRKIMVEGLGFSFTIIELAVLTGMAVTLTIVSIKRFKHRLQ